MKPVKKSWTDKNFVINFDIFLCKRSKTLYLQRIKSRIAQDVDSIEYESKSLLEFKTELELLVQEEKSHLEELRQIQSDIQMVIFLNILAWHYTWFHLIRSLYSLKRMKRKFKITVLNVIDYTSH